MAASKKKRATSPLPSAAVLRNAAVGLLLLAAAAGGIALWRAWGPAIVQQPGYRLGPESIVIAPAPPAWITADLKTEAIRDARLDEESLLQADVVEHVAQAFRLHPWVARVLRVSKHYPSRIVVQLQYRRPIAMVEVVKEGRRGLLPIDTAGVLLPPGDFAPNEVRNFLRIAVDNAGPAGPVGTPWGDERVHGAAAIAAVLEPVWKEWHLYRVHCLTQAEQFGATDHQYELFTQQGTRILWGRSPGKEAPGETVAGEKLARLNAIVEQNGGLDASGGLDIRDTALHREPLQAVPASSPR